MRCGALKVIQPRRGYRFSLDAYLLAAFVDEKPGEHVLEIGSGSGVIAIMLSGIKGLKVTGVEVQPILAGMSRRSVELNGLMDTIEIRESDIKDYQASPSAAVLANPPYRPLKTGRLNPEGTKAVARHELKLDLDGLMSSVNKNLRRLGRFYCIYPAWRMIDLISAMRRHHLEPKRLIMVHSFPDGPAELCLVKGIKLGGRELTVETPLTIYQAPGIYSERMTRLFATLAL
ncbi:MAG: methyltransferase [Syntrophaceae bacterium]